VLRGGATVTRSSGILPRGAVAAADHAPGAVARAAS